MQGGMSGSNSDGNTTTNSHIKINSSRCVQATLSVHALDIAAAATAAATAKANATANAHAAAAAANGARMNQC